MTIIIERGKLKLNNLLVLGEEFFRVKTIKDDHANMLSYARIGWSNLWYSFHTITR